jgi:hypothetical protein
MRRKGWVEKNYFLITPQPQPHELLSSWLTRTAFAHKYPLTKFISLFLKHDGTTLSRIDMDFKNDPLLFTLLAQKSGLHHQQIMNMSLRNGEGFLFDVEYNTLYPPKIIRKLKDKRTHYGLLYCPGCLKEDTHPYWRKHWRYLFYNACPRHQIFLTDRCGRCYERIRFNKMEISNELVYCSKCGRDLRLTVTKKVSNEQQYGLAAIKWFSNGLEEGCFTINNTKIHSLFVFRAYTFLSTLANKGSHLKYSTFPLIYDYQELCKKEQHFHSTKATPIYKNFYLTSLVYHIFQNFPHNLIEFSEENHLTHRDFVHDFKHIPFWYQNVIDKYIPMQNKTGREISESEVVGAIKYLTNIGNKVTQESVAGVLGCHYTIHKGFKRIYKKLQIG